jgi:phage portal protein BeeE
MRIGRFRIFERKDASLANPDPAMMEMFGVPGCGSITRAQALAVPAVNAAIRAISEAAATLAVGVVELQDDGTDKAVPGHPVAKLLQGDVNEWTGGFELIRDLIAMALTNDSGGLAWINRVENRPHEIIQYRPGMMAVTFADTGEAVLYDQRHFASSRGRGSSAFTI